MRSAHDYGLHQLPGPQMPGVQFGQQSSGIGLRQ